MFVNLGDLPENHHFLYGAYYWTKVTMDNDSGGLRLTKQGKESLWTNMKPSTQVIPIIVGIKGKTNNHAN